MKFLLNSKMLVLLSMFTMSVYSSNALSFHQAFYNTDDDRLTIDWSIWFNGFDDLGINVDYILVKVTHRTQGTYREYVVSNDKSSLSLQDIEISDLKNNIWWEVIFYDNGNPKPSFGILRFCNLNPNHKYC
ncbi:MAG: hypothetical protein AAGB12_02155 [Pseudomonadota bacterium]